MWALYNSCLLTLDAAQYRKDGSVLNSSNFQRGGGSRMSDRSLRSSMHRKDFDDQALSSILGPARTPTMPRAQHQPVSHHSSRETGYISDGGGNFGVAAAAAAVGAAGGSGSNVTLFLFLLSLKPD